MPELKFPGIDLSPNALKLRARSDFMRANLASLEAQIKDVTADGENKVHIHAKIISQIQRDKAEIAKIEAQIIKV
jgi:hypothetical protein